MLSAMLVLAPDRARARPAQHPEYFEGRVLMQPLVGGEGAAAVEVEVVAVFFEDGARTIPHTHATDQLLYVVSGSCVVADESGRRELGPGGMVLLPANEWHWHGAAAGGSMCHLSIRKPGPTDWDVPRRDW
ncbi:MAG TPA: cupin domain-containing protein [Thermoanaerobaculia bacterium]|nr:cupin domain-containing protein [Thermoanaerobaculia bacterium]